MSSALIVVDMQRDFTTPWGALYVPNADELCHPINRHMEKFKRIILTADWHPHNHSSFQQQGGPFPRHCVIGSAGVDFDEELDTDRACLIVRKGIDPKYDELSAFGRNPVQSMLRGALICADVRDIHICGVALDYCVLATAKDAQKLGFDVTVYPDLSYPVTEAGGKLAVERLTNMGVKIA